MDALMPLLIMLLLLCVLRNVSLWVCPWGVRIVEGLLRSLWRAARQLVWTGPVRKWGIGITVCLWLLVVTLLATIGALQSGRAENLAVVAPCWFLLAALWWGLRWLAERRYRPRPLPQRDRRRQRA